MTKLAWLAQSAVRAILVTTAALIGAVAGFLFGAYLILASPCRSTPMSSCGHPVMAGIGLGFLLAPFASAFCAYVADKFLRKLVHLPAPRRMSNHE